MAISTDNTISFASLQGFFFNQLFSSAQTLQASGVSPLTLSASALSVANLSQQFQTNLAGALESLFDAAQALQDSAQTLMSTQVGDQFESRTATSSNTAVLTGTAADQATATTYDFTVSQLAVAQINVGTSLTSSAATSLSAGAKAFTVTVGGTPYAGSVTVGAGDTNQTVLDNFATAINALDAGVTATVINDATTSRIQIVADKTGTSSTFSLSPTTGGSITFNTGANTTQTAAQNASYTLNSVPYTSETNTVVLDGGKVTATLAATSASTVTLTVGADTTTIKSAISDFVDDFNSFVTTLSTYGPFLTPSLAAGVNRAVSRVRLDLDSIGISTNSNGTLTVADDTLSSALSDDLSDVQRAIGGYTGLATQMASQANNVITSPIGEFAAKMPTFAPYNSIAPFVSQFGSMSTLNMLMSGLFVNTRV